MWQMEHILNIYMHEAAMHVDANSGLASAEDGPGLAHINALTTCLASVEQALDAVCSMDIKTFLSVPSMALARTSYAAVTLIKLYSLASAPDSKIGQVIDPANLRVEHQLDRVLKHYNLAGEQAGGRAHARFAVVLSLLRDWFIKRKDQNPALREALGGPSQPVSCVEEIYKGGEDSQVRRCSQVLIALMVEENDDATASTKRSSDGRPEQTTNSDSKPVSSSRVQRAFVRRSVKCTLKHRHKFRMDAAIPCGPGKFLRISTATIIPHGPISRHVDRNSRAILRRSRRVIPSKRRP